MDRNRLQRLAASVALLAGFAVAGCAEDGAAPGPPPAAAPAGGDGTAQPADLVAVAADPEGHDRRVLAVTGRAEPLAPTVLTVSDRGGHLVVVHRPGATPEAGTDVTVIGTVRATWDDADPPKLLGIDLDAPGREQVGAAGPGPVLYAQAVVPAAPALGTPTSGA